MKPCAIPSVAPLVVEVEAADAVDEPVEDPDPDEGREVVDPDDDPDADVPVADPAEDAPEETAAANPAAVTPSTE